MHKLIAIRAGFTNCFLLINEKKYLLVDTGTRNQAGKLLKSITSRGLSPGNLVAIFLTHAHFDHAGSVAAMHKETGARIMIHESEANFLKNGFTRIPKGTNPLFKFISSAGRKSPVERKIGGYDPAAPDIVFENSFDLKPLGFDAEILHTPGHTVGSSTLVAGDTALVGDTMFNMTGNYYPGFANDEPALLRTWQKLLDLDVKWYYPSHGRRIMKSRLIDYVRRKKIVLQ